MLSSIRFTLSALDNRSDLAESPALRVREGQVD
jgi:hypothetical protein